MWSIFSRTTANKNNKPFFQPFDIPNFLEELKCHGNCVQEHASATSAASHGKKTQSNAQELALKQFASLLGAFEFGWYEPFEPKNAGEAFFHSADRIAQMVESRNVFILREMSPICLSNEISRISITSHQSCNHSASVRLLGETALMSASCLGRLSDVNSLLTGSSLSQILCCSEHPKARGLDALFMSLFYGHVCVAKAILKWILKYFPQEISQMNRHPFCRHAELGCTSFMLACRFGDKELLNDMFELLDKCEYSRLGKKSDISVLLSSSEFNESKRNQELRLADCNGANALHHAIITANSECVEWLKEQWKSNPYYGLALDQNDVCYNVSDSCEDAKNVSKEEAEATLLEGSVFHRGIAASQCMLSPAFALLFIFHRNPKSKEHDADHHMKRFLKHAIQSDYQLLYDSLFSADSFLLSRFDFKVSVSQTLLEHELAVMMWGLCRNNQDSRRSQDLAKKHRLTAASSNSDVHSLEDPDLRTKEKSELAYHLMRNCTKSNEKRRFRQMQVQQRQEYIDNFTDSFDDEHWTESSVRKEVAHKLTEFNKNDWDSHWFKVRLLADSWCRAAPNA
jgi:hypothetical protein